LRQGWAFGFTIGGCLGLGLALAIAVPVAIYLQAKRADLVNEVATLSRELDETRDNLGKAQERLRTEADRLTSQADQDRGELAALVKEQELQSAALKKETRDAALRYADLEQQFRSERETLLAVKAELEIARGKVDGLTAQLDAKTPKATGNGGGTQVAVTVPAKRPDLYFQWREKTAKLPEKREEWSKSKANTIGTLLRRLDSGRPIKSIVDNLANQQREYVDLQKQAARTNDEIRMLDDAIRQSKAPEADLANKKKEKLAELDYIKRRIGASTAVRRVELEKLHVCWNLTPYEPKQHQLLVVPFFDKHDELWCRVRPLNAPPEDLGFVLAKLVIERPSGTKVTADVTFEWTWNNRFDEAPLKSELKEIAAAISNSSLDMTFHDQTVVNVNLSTGESKVVSK
jgi:hypothetical protein